MNRTRSKHSAVDGQSRNVDRKRRMDRPRFPGPVTVRRGRPGAADPGQGRLKTAELFAYGLARGRLCPDGGALWGRAQPNRDSTPPTSSAPLYRLNHSKGLVGGTGEPRELVRCVGQRARSTPFS
ncbi:UNVERIFIED_CONTAM: hypothetical protein Sangu_3171900 [Sesamum angustifolium]|uniref:Uncharacterized protein n=1 Tax=Sesamum angustifolium TaxID=2727405 RepID=A0AAW2JWM5_9LAMI